MNSDRSALINEIRCRHYPATPKAASAFNLLPPDALLFYREFPFGVNLFSPDLYLTSYRFVPSAHLKMLVDVHSAVSLEYSAYVAFCTTGDGNWVAIDSAGTVIEMVLETVCSNKDLRVVCKGFWEFVERALSSNGRIFWLGGQLS